MTESNINFSQKSPDILGEACAWIAQLETGNMSQADMRAFQEWISRSHAHYQQIHKLAQLSADTNVLGELIQPMHLATKERRATIGSKSVFAKFMNPVLLSCFALVFTAFAATAFYKHAGVTQHFMLSTDVGGFVERTLSDGSVLKLNTDSQIEIDFDKTHRRIRLLKGEVFFDVAHNSKRPFVVSVDDKAVKAIGTAFSVRWTEGDLSVTVSEGRVAVAPVATISSLEIKSAVTVRKNVGAGAIASTDDPVYLDAGQKLLLHEEKPLPLVEAYTPNDIRSELSWQSGILDFTKTPLSDVVNEVSRYTNLKIQISDPALRHMEFDGIFRTGETLQLFEVLEAYGLDIEYIDDTTVTIKKSF